MSHQEKRKFDIHKPLERSYPNGIQGLSSNMVLIGLNETTESTNNKRWNFLQSKYQCHCFCLKHVKTKQRSKDGKKIELF